MKRRQCGFTLLEMMVAVMVLSVLAVLVYGMLRIGMRAWESGVERVGESDLTRIGWQFVHGSLAAARSPPSRIPEDPGVHFIGSGEALEFVSELPAWLAPGGLYALQLGPLDAQSGQPGRLELLARPYVGYPDSGLDPEELPSAVLAEGVERLTFGYFGVPLQGGEPAWLDEWSGRDGLPILVRMEVSYADGSAWPALVVHPRLGIGRQFSESVDEFAGEPLEEPLDGFDPDAPGQDPPEFDDAP